jgi:ribose transport system ATP-binding protein
MTDIGIALELTGVGKRYPGTLAVDRVDLTICSGEVHALVGENGAGKSTLVKMMAGAFRDYTGRIAINGKEVALHSPAAARASGIQLIHQELSLAPALSVMENVLAGRLPRRGAILVDRRQALREAQECLARVGLEVDPLTPVEDLSQHEAQLVEIAKALANLPCILLLDEPTSALSRHEVERLFELLRRLRSLGIAIVYISHHLTEVMAIADRVTVMRDGRRAATERICDVTARQIASLMVGGAAASPPAVHGPSTANASMPKVRAERLSRFGFFREISFEIGAGEVVGLAGLSGSGRTELARSLCGIDPLDEGELYMDGDRVTPRSLRQAVEKRIAYVTEDRKNLGLALRLTVVENALVFPARGRARAGEGVKALLKELRLEPPNTSRSIRDLSGGNQQKVLLAKWLATDPSLLILDEPTRGVDVGARAIIHTAIARAAKRGAAVLLISSDIDELVSLAGRILILRRGRLCGELRGADATEENVLLAISDDLPETEAGA